MRIISITGSKCNKKYEKRIRKERCEVTDVKRENKERYKEKWRK